MSFLTEKDYEQIITFDDLDVIIEDEPSVLADLERTAITEVSSYLAGRYDVAKVFAPVADGEPDTRNPQIVLYTIDIALFHLLSRINPRNIPALREKRYDAAIAWLKAVSRGDISADLPKLETAKAFAIRIGSNPKNNNGY